MCRRKGKKRIVNCIINAYPWRGIERFEGETVVRESTEGVMVSGGGVGGGVWWGWGGRGGCDPV